ncbi:hypothetical protein [Streptomyces sp. NPDC048386]|uniref:hypothetical protein n=1 Tax=Streptomyces sp. NPDC048386 TaxID=3365541 RepID=UPI0037137D92
MWYPDGVVGAPYDSVPQQARMTLFGCGFQYNTHEFAFVLPASHAPAGRALLLQHAIRRLMAQGIGVNFRQAQPITALATSAARPARALHTATQAPPAARR